MNYETNSVESNRGRQSATLGPLDRIYDRLVRDVFGRTVPGLLLLLALGIAVTSFGEVEAALERATVGMWLLALGAGWLVSFAEVEIGRRFNLVHTAPDTITDEQAWAEEERFRATASRRQHAEYDRLAAVRDAMGTVCVSLFLSLGTVGIDFLIDLHMHDSPWEEIRNGAPAFIVLVGLGVAFQLAHRHYGRRAWSFMAYGRQKEPI